MGCVGCAFAHFETVAEVAVVPGERVLQFETIAGEVQTAAANQIASGRDWAGEALGTLISHIVTTYHEPLRKELPRLQAIATKVATVHGDKNPRLTRVSTVVVELSADLHAHMWKEDGCDFRPSMRSRAAAPRQ